MYVYKYVYMVSGSQINICRVLFYKLDGFPFSKTIFLFFIRKRVDIHEKKIWYFY